MCWVLWRDLSRREARRERVHARMRVFACAHASACERAYIWRSHAGSCAPHWQVHELAGGSVLVCGVCLGVGHGTTWCPHRPREKSRPSKPLGPDEADARAHASQAGLLLPAHVAGGGGAVAAEMLRARQAREQRRLQQEREAREKREEQKRQQLLEKERRREMEESILIAQTLSECQRLRDCLLPPEHSVGHSKRDCHSKLLAPLTFSAGMPAAECVVAPMFGLKDKGHAAKETEAEVDQGRGRDANMVARDVTKELQLAPGPPRAAKKVSSGLGLVRSPSCRTSPTSPSRTSHRSAKPSTLLELTRACSRSQSPVRDRARGAQGGHETGPPRAARKVSSGLGLVRSPSCRTSPTSPSRTSHRSAKPSTLLELTRASSRSHSPVRDRGGGGTEVMGAARTLSSSACCDGTSDRLGDGGGGRGKGGGEDTWVETDGGGDGEEGGEEGSSDGRGRTALPRLRRCVYVLHVCVCVCVCVSCTLRD